jgi:CO/xanthine dehydrogenase FAD-binding subunit
VKPPPFDYSAPRSVEEALDLLRQAPEEVSVLAGGQSLVPVLNMRLAQPRALVDLNRVEGLDGIETTAEGRVRFGSMVRQRRLESEPLVRDRLPLLTEAADHIAHLAIRTRGTVGGSLAHADPSAELPAAVLALDGEVKARSAGGKRSIPARDFFLGALETALEPAEWVEEIAVPTAQEGTGYAVEEFAYRHGDYAICGVVAVARRSGATTLVHFGVSPLAMRTRLPDGRAETIREALADADMTDDLHATAAYRRRLAEVLGARAAARAAEAAR